ncbi:aminoglycoside phosphotransferase family protein [Nonomuraea sp. NPDC046802]|uniref:phosphotransferase family protein n=1 Tax=Nonomuraea sp. NPDC046802 TaxID=3154919 RepID=UPI0033D9B358
MTGNDVYEEMRAVLAKVGRRLGMPIKDARLLRLHSNALFLLPGRDLLIRIATNPDALGGIKSSVEVTRWLAKRDFPCVFPAEVNDQPFSIHGHAVSFWRYVEASPAPAPSSGELGEILRCLHAQPLSISVGRFRDPLDSVAQTIEITRHGISLDQRQWLADRITELRRAWSEVTFPHSPGLIHGDAHPNNLMRASSGRAILGDWDHVAVGPREWDLMQVHYMHRRFGHPSAEQLDEFARAYGWDVRDWPGLSLLVAIREISGLSPYVRTASTKEFSRKELARRVNSLQRGDAEVRWASPPAEG